MIDFLIHLDEQLIVFLNSFHSEWADHFMMSITGRLIWLPLYLILALTLIWRFGIIKGLIVVALIGLAAACADMLIAKVIRPYFERLRPSHVESEVSQLLQFVADERHPNGYCPQGYGFPSCHGGNTIALAMASSLVLRRALFVAFIFFWAALLCYSRIYLGVHYPGDIIIGGLIGATLGWLFGRLALQATTWKRLPDSPDHTPRVVAVVTLAPVYAGVLILVYAAVNAAI